MGFDLGSRDLLTYELVQRFIYLIKIDYFVLMVTVCLPQRDLVL